MPLVAIDPYRVLEVASAMMNAAALDEQAKDWTTLDVASGAIAVIWISSRRRAPFYRDMPTEERDRNITELGSFLRDVHHAIDPFLMEPQ